MKREKDIKNSRTHLREEGIVLQQSIWGEKSEKICLKISLFSFCFCSVIFFRIFVVFPQKSLTPVESRKRIVVMM